MRKKLLIAGVVGALSAGAVLFYHFQRTAEPSVTEQSFSEQGGNSDGQQRSKSELETNAQPRTSGVWGEGASIKVPKTPRRKAKAPRKNKPVKAKDESVQEAGPELAGLSSIYGEEKVSSSKKPQKNLYGVPIDSWVLSQRNRIAGMGPEPAPGNVRVYVQCWEVKKKRFQSLNSTQCRKIRIKSSFDEIARIK